MDTVLYEIWDVYGNVGEDSSLLGCYAFSIGN
jgi:hypothetical protein